MDVLRQAFESLGLCGVATFLGSGNVVFETMARDARLLEKKIERRLTKALGYSVSVFIRTDAELKKIAAFEPFERPAISRTDVNIILLTNVLDRKSRAKLKALTTETDGFRVHGREIYWWRRKKPGTALFSTVPFAKALSRPFTIRSASTIAKLVTKWP
jgi:uncharacterized protein (DUF1697 family)